MTPGTMTLTTNHLLRILPLNKKALVICSAFFTCVVLYLSYSWKFSRTDLSSSVVSLLGTSLPRSSMERKCNCTVSCPTILTSTFDRQAASDRGMSQGMDVNMETVDEVDETDKDNDRDCVGLAQRFPQAIIIGVRKGGTRALINMLKIHPEIFAARTEIHYFDRDENFFKGVQWYIEKMPFTNKNHITIEKSPSYFVVDHVPQRMSMLSQQLKLLLIVRNPVERVVSDFLQLDSKRLKKNGNRYTFEELVFRSSGAVNERYSPVSISMYDIHFQKWLKHFSLEQIHIVDGDALIENPIPELQKAEKFLGVSTYFNENMFYFNETKGFYCWKKSGKPTCLGDAKGREHPNLSTSVRSKLQNFFSSHNENFFHLCQCHFRW